MSKRRLNPSFPSTQPLDGPAPHLPKSKPFKPALTAPKKADTPVPATEPIAKPSGAPRFNDPPNEKHQL